MGKIKENLKAGKTEVLDADLSKFFDTIPHEKLFKALEERISDPRILKLIEKWLKAPVLENGQLKGGKKNKTGTPQGGVISPLLANIYLNLLDRNVDKANNLFQKFGCTVRYDKDIKGRNLRYWNIYPSKKSEKKIRDKVKVYLKTHGHCNAKQVSRDLNLLLRGWINYFNVEGVSYPAMSNRRVRFYLSNKLTKYYKRKSQRRCRLYRQNAFEVLVSKYGLIDPTKYILLKT